MIAAGVDGLQVSHTHTHEEMEKNTHTRTHTLCRLFFAPRQPDIVGFTQKEKRCRKREESEGKKRGGKRGVEGEREREGGRKRKK